MSLFKRGRHKRPKKQKKVQLDEIAQIGDMIIARKGKEVFMQSVRQKGEHERIKAQFIADYPSICAEIDASISRIKELVHSMEPLQLLHCSYFSFAVAMMDKPSEFQMGTNEVMLARMLDYIQAVIVSIPPLVEYPKFDQSRWDELSKEVSKLYGELMSKFFIAQTFKLSTEDSRFDNEEYSEVFHQSQSLRLTVRGDRYVYHEVQHFKDFLTPHDAVLRELFNVTAEDLVQGFSQILSSLTVGVQKSFDDLFELQQRSVDATEEKLKTERDLPEDVGALLRSAVDADPELKALADSFKGKFFELDLFDLQKVTSLPSNVLDALSLSAGANPEFNQGEYAGWPLKELPTRVHPFLKINNKYYCFDMYGLADNLYRGIENAIMKLKPEYRVTWNKLQQEITEETALTLFRRALPEAWSQKNLYIKIKEGVFEEIADGLVIFDGHLIVIQVKAGKFTWTAPTTDFDAYITSLKTLIEAPARQGERLIKLVEENPEVPLFDIHGNLVHTIRSCEIKHMSVCSLTMENINEYAARSDKLKGLGISIEDIPLWALSFDDLRVYVDIIDNPLIFIHFLELRVRAAVAKAVKMTDELDHLGLYLSTNNYIQVAEDMGGGQPNTHTAFFGYREKIDEYFANLQFDPASAVKPKQDLPQRLQEIIDVLEAKKIKDRTFLASFLLNGGSELRKDIDDGIKVCLERSKFRGVVVPMSLFGSDCQVTFNCIRPDVAQPSEQELKEKLYITLISAEEKERLMVNLYFDMELKITDVKFETLKISDLNDEQLVAMKIETEKAKVKRVSFHKREYGKIGRNDLCPCGSGKKYKKCCGR